MEPYLIYEEKEWVALSKPAGLQMHAARFKAKDARPERTLADWVLERYPETAKVGDDPKERPGIVHRLDKSTSGIVLIAKSQDYFLYLKSLFQDRLIKKTYLALARGHFGVEKGTIDKPIGIISGSTRRSVRSEKMSKEAITNFFVLKELVREEDEFKSSLLKVEPKTGRTHQIRVHLSSANHAVLGDNLYGPKKNPFWVSRLMLHAWSLEFESAPGKKMSLEAAPDNDFTETFRDAGGAKEPWKLSTET